MTAKMRQRRAEADPTRPRPSEKLSQRNNTIETVGHRRILTYYSSLCFLLLLLGASVAVYRFHYSSPKSTPRVLSVYERGLVKSDADYREILSENSRVSGNRSHRHFSSPVLAYITPWNPRGYEVAKEFTSKFTHLSPVWYELKSQGKKLFLDGRHNADMGWIYELRNNGNALVLPRIVLEAFPVDLLLKKQQWSKACDIIIKECKEMEYDGIVLESWSRWARYGILHDPGMRSTALKFIKELGHAMHSVNSVRNASHHLELIYVIPASHSPDLTEYDFGPQDLQELSDAIDGFSLMTYDFSGPQNPGPNAPLSWMHSSMQLLLANDGEGGGTFRHTHMIFLGINLYGNDFVLSEGSGGGAIIGKDYLSLLEQHRPVLRWDEKNAEHFFIYSPDNRRHAVFYPSLKSISTRLDEARSWGAGISLWEIGQGLNYFYELL